MSRPKDDLAGVAIDLAAGQDHLLKLIERQKKQESDATRGRAVGDSPTTAADGSSSKVDGVAVTSEQPKRTGRGVKSTRASSRTEAEAWVTPSFKIKASRSRQIDQLYFSMRAKGTGAKTKQELIDEALDWLTKKYD